MYLHTCRGFKSAKSLGLQIANPLITNPQIQKKLGSHIANLQISGRSANLTNYLKILSSQKRWGQEGYQSIHLDFVLNRRCF